MSTFLTVCAGWIGGALLLGVGIGKFLKRTRADDAVVSKDWRRQQRTASYRNQFDGVSWTWPVKK